MNEEQAALCGICSQSVNLELDRSVDENGRPVHSLCYLQKLVSIAQVTQCKISDLLRRKVKRIA
jgi:hypothetical protein